MMKKYVKNSRFTLIEIVVSMGVFLILLSMLLSFFSGTRQVWRTLRSRNESFENSRVAMNLMTELLQCSVASRDKIGFFIGNGTVDSADNCTFYTHSTRDLSDGADASKYGDLDNLHVVKLFVEKKDGELVICSQRVNGMAISSTDTWKTRPEVTANKKVIIPGVVKVNFKSLIPRADKANRPSALEIMLSMFDNKDNYRHWYNDLGGENLTEPEEAKKFRQEHEYVFSRVISFEDIEKPIYEVSDETATP